MNTPMHPANRFFSLLRKGQGAVKAINLELLEFTYSFFDG